MSTIAVAVPGSRTPDPWKRVNYTHGLVLGVDEFVQEQAFFLGKDHLHNRMLHGYGTVAGLQVKLAGSQLSVSPGLALDPAGREIRVCGDMCADLSQWVTRNAAYLPDGKYDVHLVLCYRECQTDSVPVPGEPCRSQADAVAASRVTETFELRLRIPATSTPNANAPAELYYADPTQASEDLVRTFGDLLERIQITADATTFTSSAALDDLVRHLAPGWMPSTPIYLDPTTARDFLRRALLVWVTEVRPTVLKQELGDPCDPEDGSCVLLAEVPVTVSGRAFKSADQPLTERRPYLLDTRVLQEWLLCGRDGPEREVPARTFATVQRLPLSAPGAHDRLRVWLHCPELAALPQNAVMVSINGSTAWSYPDPPLPLGGNVYVIPLQTHLPDDARVALRFEHGYIPLAGGTRRLTEVVNDPSFSYLDRDAYSLYAYFACTPAAGDLAGVYPDPTVVKLQGKPIAPRSPIPGDILAYEPDSAGTLQWTPSAPGRDLGGQYPAPSVVGLQGRPVDSAQPADGQVLTWGLTHGTPQAYAWTPAPPNRSPTGDATGDLTGQYPGPTVAKIRGVLVAAQQPVEGQVLTYQKVQPSDPQPQWVPAPAPGAALGPGQIDVRGTYPDLTVRGLQTHPVSPGDPRPWDLLVWLDPTAIVEATNGAADLLKRLEGKIGGRSELVAELIKLLDELAPDPRERAALAKRIVAGDAPPEFRALAAQWTPFPPAFVGTPLLATEGYSIVAGGYFSASGLDLVPAQLGAVRYPVFNQLSFEQGVEARLPTGEPSVTFPGTFDGYVRPDSGMIYIVQASYFPTDAREWPRPLSFDFSRETFTLGITAAAGQKELKVEGRVTVEISRIDRNP